MRDFLKGVVFGVLFCNPIEVRTIVDRVSSHLGEEVTSMKGNIRDAKQRYQDELRKNPNS
jgi:hypothetical protein